MKSIKTGFVVVVMLAVAYGVWVMLNKKPIAGQLGLNNAAQWAPPTLDFGQGAQNPPSDYAPPTITPPETMPPGNSAFTGATLQPPSVVAPSDAGGVSPYGQTEAAAPAPVVGSQAYEHQFAPAPVEAAPVSGNSVYSGGGQLQPPSEMQRYESTAEGSAPLDGSASDAGTAPLDNSGFTNAWRGAQDQIASGELADALFTLSLWYDSPDVPADMQPQLVDLLDQLAGHVIYSTEHLLEPPHEVRAGESLESIAAQYDVPWQLLANINGIADPAQLTEGTTLKVVRGPFQATIDLKRQELLLTVGRRYAGRFPIGLGNDPAPMTGSYSVREKEEQHTFYDREGLAREPGSPENPYGPYWIGLGGRLAIHGAPAPGERESTGSIVVSPEDAADLFAILSKDSPVIIR